MGADERRLLQVARDGLARITRPVRRAVRGKRSVLGTSITDNEAFPDFCNRAATDPSTFKAFRSHPTLIETLEHVSVEDGRTCLARLLADEEVAARLPFLLEKDAIGSPKQHSYPQCGRVSPTTLRYIKILTDLRHRFGSLDGLHLAEIGVGYGGQCRIITAMHPVASYTLIDLPAVLGLAERYLETAGVSTPLRFVDGNTVDLVHSDLVVSNYAFSELRREVQDRYFANVLRQSARGYMICNQITPPEFRSMPAAELVAALAGAELQPEEPLTYPGNVTVVWGGRTANGD